MSLLISEHVESREQTVGVDNPTVSLKYTVAGTEDDAAIRALVQATIPSTYLGLAFQDYRIQHLGGGIWEAVARYGKKEPKEPGQSSYSFDTGGGTQKITQSLMTMRAYARLEANSSGLYMPIPPNFQGAIGVNNESVEGCDITVPVFHFSETHYFAANAITQAYKFNLFYLTGTVNNAPFKGFAAGEVLFLGASGQQRGVEDWEIAFKFAASPNANNLTVGSITGIVKLGWEYMWVRYADAVDQNVLVKQPRFVYVEQVYRYADFSLLGIGV
jgi:hypothetical protein